MSQPLEKRVLIIDPVHARGGMDHYCIPLANEQKKLGYTVALATNAEVSQLSAAEGLSVHPYFGGLFASNSKVKNLIWFTFGTLRATAWAMLNRPLAIHIHLFQYTALELFLAAMAKMTGRSVVATIHDIESLRNGANSRAIQGAVFRFADALIVHNDSSRAELLLLLPERRQDIYMIRHGNYIELMQQFGQETISAIAQEPGALRILFFGQIKRVKGLEILLDAAQILSRKGINFTLSIKGKPSDYQPADIEVMLHERDLYDRTQLRLGYLPTEDIVTALKEADVIVLPYRRIYQSGVMLLAISAGTVVVASDLPPMREIIEDEQNGFIFLDGKPKELAGVLEKIAGLSPNERKKISKNAFFTARDKHSWNDIAKATIEAYAHVPKSKR